MSENPPQFKPELIERMREMDKGTVHKILERKLEEGEIISDAEGGGKKSVETITECDGREHTRLQEEIQYNAQGVVAEVTELEKTILGPCDCENRTEDNASALSAAA